jgi:hypothetical protein
MPDVSPRFDAKLVRPAESQVWPKTFSVCCVVNDWSLYSEHREALRAQGFDDRSCEFLVCDNSGSNNLSAFQAVRRFLQEATGQYVIIAHADTAPLEPMTKLISALENLTTVHPNWGVVGNAGVGGTVVDPVTGKKTFAHAFSVKMPDVGPLIEHPVVKVDCIDENVMIIRNSAGITVSNDLDGFHFYAVDLCLIARRLGYESFVVDFLWRHDSHGNMDSRFFEAREIIQEKLRRCYSQLRSPTCCTTLYWGPSVWEELESNLQAMRNLEADPARRLEAKKIFLERVSEQHKVFPLLCSISGATRHSQIALSRYAKEFAGRVKCSHRVLRDWFYWRILWRAKIALRPIWRDIVWWRQNWKNRVRAHFGR